MTGFWLVWQGAHDVLSPWLVTTYILYAVAGLCWLPVVWIQIQLKTMLARSVEKSMPLPGRYHRLFRLWFILGWPAFIGLVVIFFLMVFKPA